MEQNDQAPSLHNILFNEKVQRSIIDEAIVFMNSIGTFKCPPLLGEEPDISKPKNIGHQTSASFLTCPREEDLNVDYLNFKTLAEKMATETKTKSSPLFLTWTTLWLVFVSDPLKNRIKQATSQSVYEMYFASFEDRMSTAIVGDINYHDRNMPPIATQEAASLVTNEWMIYHQIQGAT